MISHLSGTLFEKSTQSIIIEVGGVGYEIFVPYPPFTPFPNTMSRLVCISTPT